MIPVDQTTFGDGSDGNEPGNCWSACIASILELSLSEVPNFTAAGGDGRWFEETSSWLRKRGLWVLVQTWGEEDARHVPPEVWSSGYIARGALVILTGRAERGFDHAVVARAQGAGPVIVHDPHLSRSGLLSHKDVSTLIPLDPVRLLP